MYDILQLNDKLVTELKEIAQKLGVKGIAKLSKQDLIYKILDEQALAEKNATDRVVPVVDEPNPQTGRRPRKTTTVVVDVTPEAPKQPLPEPAVEPPANRRETPRKENVGQQRRNEQPERSNPGNKPAPAAPKTEQRRETPPAQNQPTPQNQQQRQEGNAQNRKR
ncbi:MAG: Rho termination factor N-terminal domain-containing protein, partial [Saprospiraceae bacterium]|nr:Rho termination factor N-terminal domain-containing protein [Saprospiraceae bacterium]